MQEKVWVAELRKLSEHCNFGNSLDVMLRDRLVCGLRDEALQRRLLTETSLNFSQAQEKALAAETANSHVQEIRGSSTVSAMPLYQKQTHTQKQLSKMQYERQMNCSGCGGNHARAQCRFKDAECHACRRKGHIQRVCRNKLNKKSVHEQELDNDNTHNFEDENLDAFHLKYVCLNNVETPNMKTTVLINGRPCVMEVDSGAKVSIIDKGTFDRLHPQKTPQLVKSPYVVKDYNKQPVEILGECQVHVKYASFDLVLPLLIAKKQRQGLLGLNWFEPLGIRVTGIHSIQHSILDDVLSKFSDVFKEELGSFKGNPIKLHLDPAVRPIQLKARNVPFALRPKIEKELQRLQDQGVLEPVSYSDWATPVVPVLKSNGEIRLCGDYKCTLNKALGNHQYPVPAVNQILAELSGSRHFIKLDLSQAYLQLLVDEESAMAQTIVTHRGAFKCNRLQFGISTAPGIFQKFIETLLANIPGVLPYYDDILIKASTLEELAERLHEVLRRFSKAGLRLSQKKCIIGASKIEFLGYEIDEKGIKPTKDKVKAIQEAPTPTKKEELQAFLGLLNFYHVFLQDKATVAEPLHRLLDKGAAWQWEKRHTEAFKKVKKLLSDDSLLIHFDEKKPIILTCDASQYGIGAVLSHKLTEGVEAPVAYYSRTMSQTERRYAQIDKEALAIILGVKKFHNYLYGHKFEIRTDHKPLLGLLANDKPTPTMLSPRMQRWSLALSSYDYNLVYHPGKSISNADGLSRLPDPQLIDDNTSPNEILLLEALNKPPLSARDIARMTSQDPILARVHNWVLKGWPHDKPNSDFDPFFQRKLEISAHKGCLLWGCRVIIPKKAQEHMLATLHDSHQGIVRTKSLARSYMWWPCMDKQIENIVNRCNICQQTRHAPPKTLGTWECTKKPWSRLHIDYAGPFQGSLFLIVVDSYSKWLEVIKVSSTDSAGAIGALRKLFSTHGIPDTIVSDNGTSFTSAEFAKFLDNNGIHQLLIAPRHPSSNGQAERMVQTTKDSLRRIITGNWSSRLASFLLAQHATPNTSTNVSPAELLMNRRLKTCLDRLHPDFANINTGKNLSSSRIRMFAPLDPVYARGFPPYDKWVPSTITEVIGQTMYKVATRDGMVWKRHIDQLRRRQDTSHCVPDTVSCETQMANDLIPPPLLTDLPSGYDRNAEATVSNRDPEPAEPSTIPEPAHADTSHETAPTGSGNVPDTASSTAGPSRPARAKQAPSWFKDYIT